MKLGSLNWVRKGLDTQGQELNCLVLMSFNSHTALYYREQHSPLAGGSKNRLMCPEMETKYPLALHLSSGVGREGKLEAELGKSSLGSHNGASPRAGRQELLASVI